MTDLNPPNLKDIVNHTLQEVFPKDPKSVSNHSGIITWKSKKIPNALITKVKGKKYLGLLKKDKTGQEYWSYHLLTKWEEQSAKAKSSEINHEQSNNSNHSEPAN